MLLVRRDNGIGLAPAAGPRLKIFSLDPAPKLLKPGAVNGFLAGADFETVVFRRIVAGRHLYSPIEIEVKKRKVKHGGRTNTDIIDLETGGLEPVHDRLGVAFRSGAAVPPYRHPLSAFFGHGAPVHLT